MSNIPCTWAWAHHLNDAGIKTRFLNHARCSNNMNSKYLHSFISPFIHFPMASYRNRWESRWIAYHAGIINSYQRFSWISVLYSYHSRELLTTGIGSCFSLLICMRGGFLMVSKTCRDLAKIQLDSKFSERKFLNVYLISVIAVNLLRYHWIYQTLRSYVYYGLTNNLAIMFSVDLTRISITPDFS